MIIAKKVQMTSLGRYDAFLIKPRLIENSWPVSLLFQNPWSHINLIFITIEDTELDIGLPNISAGHDGYVIYAVLGIG